MKKQFFNYISSQWRNPNLIGSVEKKNCSVLFQDDSKLEKNLKFTETLSMAATILCASRDFFVTVFNNREESCSKKCVPVLFIDEI